MSTPPPPLLEPLYQQQPPPIAAAQQQAFTSHPGHGSVGSVIAVLAVIIILAAAAVMVGRLCSGRGIMGHYSHYNIENWVETKCSSCIDGSVEAPVPRRVVEHRSSSASVDAAPEESPEQEAKEEEGSDQLHNRQQRVQV